MQNYGNMALKDILFTSQMINSLEFQNFLVALIIIDHNVTCKSGSLGFANSDMCHSNFFFSSYVLYRLNTSNFAKLYWTVEPIITRLNEEMIRFFLSIFDIETNNFTETGRTELLMWLAEQRI
jgi:hypothetical protein